MKGDGGGGGRRAREISRKAEHDKGKVEGTRENGAGRNRV